MATISVSELKPGEKILEDVLTKFNNILIPKGRMVSERDLQVLKAFLIPSVQIEGKAVETEGTSDDGAAEEMSLNGVPPFYKSYDHMLQLLKRVFNIANAGGENLPILEIRTALEQLIQHIDYYNVLSFSPRNFELKDYLYHNSITVSLTSYTLARWMNMPTKDLIPVALGGLLHDIGNAKIDDGILNKPTKLSTAELEEMKKHTIIGYQILKSVPAINEGVKLCALQHHERENGSGYPLGVQGDKIHPYSKIVAVSDMFHAMRTDRFHKKGVSPYLVLEQLHDEAFGLLDPITVQTFITKVTAFHNGTIVKLSDDRIGEIVFSERAHPTRPWVNVNGQIVNLTLERNLYIQKVIQI